MDGAPRALRPCRLSRTRIATQARRPPVGAESERHKPLGVIESDCPRCFQGSAAYQRPSELRSRLGYSEWANSATSLSLGHVRLLSGRERAATAATSCQQPPAPHPPIRVAQAGSATLREQARPPFRARPLSRNPNSALPQHSFMMCRGDNSASPSRALVSVGVGPFFLWPRKLPPRSAALAPSAGAGRPLRQGRRAEAESSRSESTTGRPSRPVRVERLRRLRSRRIRALANSNDDEHRRAFWRSNSRTRTRPPTSHPARCVSSATGSQTPAPRKPEPSENAACVTTQQPAR